MTSEGDFGLLGELHGSTECRGDPKKATRGDFGSTLGAKEAGGALPQGSGVFHLGAPGDDFGGPLGSLGTALESLGGHLGALWSLLETFCMHLDALWDHTGITLGDFVVTWRALCNLLMHLRIVLDRYG